MNNENINEYLNNMILQTYFLRSNSLKAATQYTTWFIFPRAALLRSPAVLFTYPPSLTGSVKIQYWELPCHQLRHQIWLFSPSHVFTLKKSRSPFLAFIKNKNLIWSDFVVLITFEIKIFLTLMIFSGFRIFEKSESVGSNQLGDY